jgi:hypothetical protein
MITEKRKAKRINSHIVVEMGLPGEFPRYCGYIENLSEKGIGVISLDSFQVGEKLTLNFVLTGTVDRVTTVAAVVRKEEQSIGILNYYALTFEGLSQTDYLKITRYIRENAA